MTTQPINRYIEMQQLEFYSQTDSESMNAADRMLIRSGIRFYTENCFSIPAPIVSKYYESYHLLYWQGDYILSQIEAGYIDEYTVRYHKHLCRGSIVANPNAQYALSFRKPADHWNIKPIVIISGNPGKVNL